MAQKILSQRCLDVALSRDVIEFDIDQVALAHDAAATLSRAKTAGLKKTSCEVAVAYDASPVRLSSDRGIVEDDALALGLVVSRAGNGFPAPVHLERFASPARLCVTDSPRLASVGGIGMMPFTLSSAELATALVTGKASLRVPKSIAVLMSGRLRPFVCARDVALELLRRNLKDVVKKAADASGAPIVLEFSGQSIRFFSVGERAQIAQVARAAGASAALFPSDERTEVFLRDQRRSKAHRALTPDAGAEFVEVVNLDVGAVDPLVQDENGAVKSLREIGDLAVSTVLVGGDSGATLRDMLAVAALLKSKRVHDRVSFLVAPPSRQMLDVMSRAGALADLFATGARLIEPDSRVLDGTFYGSHDKQSPAQLRTCDQAEGGAPARVASAETCAYAVAYGKLGDPRGFKRPVRVTVPRELPTDDVLVARKALGRAPTKKRSSD